MVNSRAARVRAGCAVLALALTAGATDAAADETRNASTAKGRSSPAEPELQLRLSSHYLMAPAYVRALVRLRPHADNRALHVAIDGDVFYRSSWIPLEGAASARTHQIDWKSLPSGSYEVSVTVVGAEGPRRQVTRPLVVIGPVHEAPSAPLSSRGEATGVPRGVDGPR